MGLFWQILAAGGALVAVLFVGRVLWNLFGPV